MKMTHSIRLGGHVDYDDFQPYIEAFISSPILKRRTYPINFLIDTGSTITTLLDADVKRLGIDISKLDKSKFPALGIGGLATTYVLPEVTLIFNRGGNRFHFENLDYVEVIVHNDERLLLPFSILGADVISRFHLDFDDDIVFLEK
jgi:hypothetical protein